MKKITTTSKLMLKGGLEATCTFGDQVTMSYPVVLIIQGNIASPVTHALLGLRNADGTNGVSCYFPPIGG